MLSPVVNAPQGFAELFDAAAVAAELERLPELHNGQERDLRTEPAITREHVANNTEVRKAMRARGIRPEQLPAAEDVKRVERRLAREVKRLPRESKKLGHRGKEHDAP